jgi:hypothetical protein
MRAKALSEADIQGVPASLLETNWQSVQAISRKSRPGLKRHEKAADERAR